MRGSEFRSRLHFEFGSCLTGAAESKPDYKVSGSERKKLEKKQKRKLLIDRRRKERSAWFASDLLRPLSEGKKKRKAGRDSRTQHLRAPFTWREKSDHNLTPAVIRLILWSRKRRNVICLIRQQKIFDDKLDQHAWISVQHADVLRKQLLNGLTIFEIYWQNNHST